MVSIVITAYNVAPWIEEAISSACNQSYRDIEIIVVEDCSSDGTRDKLSQIKDWRVKVIYNSTNMGAGASRRKGIEAAEGEYILLLDGDDWLEDDFIETLYNYAKEHDADIVSGGIRIANSDGSWEGKSYGNCIVEGREKLTRFWGERIVFMNNKLIRKELHNKVPYCTRKFIEDTPVIIPQLFFANKVVYADNIGYNYRMRPDSLTHTACRFKNALFRALCAADLIAFFEKHDKKMLTSIPLANGYMQCLKELKESNPDREMIEKYREEWIEFTRGLIDRLT
jgi:glycosyltransferase involved in cell wall biosynthesis